MRYFATYLIYIAVLVRAVGWSQDTSPVPTPVWMLLGIFGLILFSEQALTRRLPWYPRLYTSVQSGLVIAMLYTAPTLDFLSMLFYPLSFQAVRFFSLRVGLVWIGVFSLAMIGMFRFGLDPEGGITMVLGASAANVLMGSYAQLMRRIEQRRQENQRLFGDLQEAYRQLKGSAAQMEALAAAEERHRLVRELHDSLTQTLFSMNLAVQGAQLSLQEAPTRLEEHLTRLQSLAGSAASEVQALKARALTGQVPPRPFARDGLAAAIQQLAGERLEQDGLEVTFEVAGQRDLPEPVQANLYRIVQEALNNVTRHAGVHRAQVRLCLDGAPASLDVDDPGCGFDTSLLSVQAQEGSERRSSFGLKGMAERAREIGWELEIRSHPGQGTHIRAVEKMA